MRRAHISKNKPNLREEWQYSREKYFRVLLKGNLVSQSLGAPSADAPRPAPDSHTGRLWYENLYQRDPRGRKNMPTLRSASVSRSGEIRLFLWGGVHMSKCQEWQLTQVGEGRQFSSSGRCLWGGCPVSQRLGGISVRQPVGLRALGKCWPVRLAGVLSGTGSSALLL